MRILSEAVSLENISYALGPEFLRLPPATPQDPFRLGWTAPKFHEPEDLTLSNVSLVTAEGIAVLAGIKEMPHSYGGATIRLNADRKKAYRSKSLNSIIESISRLDYKSSTLIEYSDAHYVRGPVLFQLGSVTDVLNVQARIIEWIPHLPAFVTADQHERIIECLNGFIQEGLLNVLEHAYSFAPNSGAFCALSMAPASSYLRHTIATRAQRRWLQQHSEQIILEMAITDIGKGVPATLWSHSQQQRPVDVTLDIKDNDVDLRATMQSQLCLDAFHHSTTSKPQEKFATPFHALNFRGLYRARLPIATYDGYITLTSGRGRSGYGLDDGHITPSTDKLDTRGSALPGATIAVHLALPLRHVDKLRVRQMPRQALKELPAFPVASVNSLGQIQKAISQSLEDSKHLGLLGLVCPFANLRSGLEVGNSFRPTMQVGELVATLQALPPDLVPVFFFLENAENHELYALEEASGAHLALGFPRLIGLVEPTTLAVRWKITGVYSTSASRLIEDLEATGVAVLNEGNTGEVVSLAQAFADNYPTLLTLAAYPEQKYHKLTLNLFSSRVGEKHAEAGFSHALKQHWSNVEVQKRVIIKEPDKVVRLHTGTIVKRYLCVLFLLDSAPMLSHTVGNAFLRLVAPESELSSGVVVSDDHGSRFVAQHILHRNKRRIRIVTSDEALLTLRGSTVVLFVDAIFKGRTVTSVASNLRRHGVAVSAVVTCVDLRQRPRASTIDGIPVKELMSFEGFDPGELTDTRLPAIEIDRVTHVPIVKHRSEYAELAAGIEEQILLEHSELPYTHGYHELGGRLHSISMNTERLAGGAPGLFAAAIASRISAFIERTASSKVRLLLLTRDVGVIAHNLPHIIASLRRERIGRIDHSILPVDYVGPRPLFGHHHTDMSSLSTVVSHGNQLSLFEGGAFPSDTIVVFMDDAAVTGKLLRNAVYLSLGIGNAHVRGVMALVVVNRLSPSETRLMSTILSLTKRIESGEYAVPFDFQSLFRLQVQSHDTNGSFSHGLLRQIEAYGRIYSKEIREYFQAVSIRTRSSSQPIGCTPFLLPTECHLGQVSAGAAHFRHLLALHQQNEGVLAELLASFAMLRESAPHELIHVLALEPELLTDGMFRNACEKDITSTCVSRLVATAPLEEKSNSIVVLAWLRDPFIEHLDPIINICMPHDTLRKQFALFAIAIFSSSALTLARVTEALSRRGGEELEFGARWTRLRIEAGTRGHSQASGRGTSEAEDKVRDVLERMSRHSVCLDNHWDIVYVGVVGILDDWGNEDLDDIATNELIAGLLNLVTLARDTLIPALRACGALRDKLDMPIDEGIEDGYGEALAVLERIDSARPRSANEVTEERLKFLREELDRLRTLTWGMRLSSEDVLGATQRGCPPLLCSAIRAILCDPEGIILNQLELMQPRHSRHARTLTRDSMYVCPIPADEMAKVVEPLVRNIIDHGLIETAKVSVSQDSEGYVTFCIENEQRGPDEEPHGRRGVWRSETRARGYDVTVNGGVAGSSYVTHICCQVTCVVSLSRERA